MSGSCTKVNDGLDILSFFVVGRWYLCGMNVYGINTEISGTLIEFDTPMFYLGLAKSQPIRPKNCYRLSFLIGEEVFDVVLDSTRCWKELNKAEYL